MPAVILGAANLDSSRETLLNVFGLIALGAGLVTLFGALAYVMFGRVEFPAPVPEGGATLFEPGADAGTATAIGLAPLGLVADATRVERREAPAGPTNAYFVAKSGKDKGRQFPIPDGQPVVIGRSAKDAQVVLDDARVSSAHAQVRLVNGKYTLVDLNSTNGSWLIVEGRTEPIRKALELQDGDQVRLGHTVLAFVDTRKGGPS